MKNLPMCENVYRAIQKISEITERPPSLIRVSPQFYDQLVAELSNPDIMIAGNLLTISQYMAGDKKIEFCGIEVIINSKIPQFAVFSDPTFPVDGDFVPHGKRFVTADGLEIANPYC